MNRKVAQEERPSLQQAQRAFAAHLRDPAAHPPPADIEDRRMKIYRELFYNNIEDFLAQAFPVLRRISTDTVWHARVRDFYARHVCRDPQFYRLAEAFLRYVEDERGVQADDPPFLAELCHYEWVELALGVAEQELPLQQADAQGDLLAGRPLLSPLAWLLSYAWPVHEIGPEHLPKEPPAQVTYLIVYRDRADEVRFLQVNAVTARLVQLLDEDAQASGRALLQRIAAELAHPQPAAVLDEGARILADLSARDIVLGTRR